MGTEALKTQTPIENPSQLDPTAAGIVDPTVDPNAVAREEIVHAFETGQQEITKILGMPAFGEAVETANLDPWGFANPAYWRFVAHSVGDYIDRRRGREGNSLALSAQELIALTPDFLFTERALNEKAIPKNNPEHKVAKQTVSLFNSKLRLFAELYPEVHASDILEALNGFSQRAIEDHRLVQASADQLKSTLVGAQHEVAFADILEVTGRQHRITSVDEDLEAIDYVVQGHYRELEVDLKASLSEVDQKNKGSKAAYAIRPDGKIIMYSMITDAELADRFYISPSLAAEKAPIVDAMLTAAEQGEVKLITAT